MPKGPQGQKRPADVIGNAVLEVEDELNLLFERYLVVIDLDVDLELHQITIGFSDSRCRRSAANGCATTTTPF